MYPLQKLSKLPTFRISRWLVLILILVAHNIFAQSDKVNTNEFMLAIFEDITTRSTSSSDSTHAISFKAPIIEEYEFRTETNDFDLDEQDYLIRVSPSTRKIRRAQHKVFEGYLSKPGVDFQSLQLDFLSDAYHYWIDHYISSSLESLYEEQEVVLEDMMTVVKRQLIFEETDFSDVVKVQTDQKELNLNKLKNSQNLQMYNLPAQFIGAEYQFEDIISVEQIKNFVTNFDPASVENPTKIASQNYKKLQVENELELEEAEAKRILRFAEISYSGPHGDPFREKVSLGVGLRLPWDGDNRLKMKELELELHNLKTEERIDGDLLFVKVSRARFDLLESIRHYEEQLALKESIEESNMELLASLKEANNNNPAYVLEFKNQLLELNIERIKPLRDIYEQYIKFLDDSLLLGQMPLKNYLSAFN